MGRPKLEPLVCECGYTTPNHPHSSITYNLQIHQVKQKQEEAASQEAVERSLGGIESLRAVGGKDEQLVAKDIQMKEQLVAKDIHKEQLVAKDEQLAAKDKQIEQLIKRPRTTTNTTNNISYTVNNVNFWS